MVLIASLFLKRTYSLILLWAATRAIKKLKIVLLKTKTYRVLIGVVNILRMTIRERIREIVSMCATAMKSVNVRNFFITETLLLTFFSPLSALPLVFY